MGLGADQLEALVECVELVNTGRTVSGGQAAAISGGLTRTTSSGELPGTTGRLASLEEVIAFGRRHRVENLSAARASDVPRLRGLRSRLDAVRPGRRRCPRPALRACSMNGASCRRNALAFFVLRSIS